MSRRVGTFFLNHWQGLSCLLELSEDIRGERLRFVEAMKEATAINVQSEFGQRLA